MSVCAVAYRLPGTLLVDPWRPLLALLHAQPFRSVGPDFFFCLRHSAGVAAADAFVKLEEGGCGYVASCPAYVITLKPDGSYHFRLKNVAVIGVRDGKLASGAWADAETAFAAAGWTTLKIRPRAEGAFRAWPTHPSRGTARHVREGEKVFARSSATTTQKRAAPCSTPSSTSCRSLPRMSMFRIGLLAVGLLAFVARRALMTVRTSEKFMADYLVLWNAHDAVAITGRFYRLDGDHPWRSKEGLKAEFDRLVAQGYDQSEIHGVVGCVLVRPAGWSCASPVSPRMAASRRRTGPHQPLSPTQVRRWLARHGHERPSRWRADDVSGELHAVAAQLCKKGHDVVRNVWAARAGTSYQPCSRC